MTRRIGIISDPHAAPEPVEESLSIFQQLGVDDIWCAGDIAGYSDRLDDTIDLLQANGCVSIIGNHEVWYLDRAAEKEPSTTYRYLHSLPVTRQMTIEGKEVYMVHASPPDSLMDGIKLLDEHGEPVDEQLDYWSSRLKGFNHDVLVVGHTHQVFAVRLAGTLVINPGSTLFNHSCAVVSFPELEVEWFALSGQPILKAWNWGTDQRTKTQKWTG